jgi:hypothetical protein
MSDDIVTQLRAKYLGQLPIVLEAADEIERLRTLARGLYEETKRCGSLHDTPATMDYEEWLEEND